MTEVHEESRGSVRDDAPAIAEESGAGSIADDRIYQIPDEQCRPRIVTEAEYRAWIESNLRSLDEYLGARDDGSDAVWDEVLRNLRVDPESGRGLTS